MSKSKIKTACVKMTGPEEQMDHRGDLGQPANPLPVKCSHCTFPDLELVAKPYLLAKGVASPTETSPAIMGNFLVRERVKRLLELVVPGVCTFHPTAEFKTKKPAPWWLAVPNRKLEALVPMASPPFCPKCREPKDWNRHPGKVWDKMNHYDSRGVDVFKTVDWNCDGTAEDDFESTNNYRKEVGEPPLPWSCHYRGIEPPAHPGRWTRLRIDRELYFSVRLAELFKRAKIKGQLVRLACFDKVQPSPEDEAWVAEKLNLLVRHDLAEASKPARGQKTEATKRWFKQYLKRNAAPGSKRADFAAVETKHKLKLPQDYQDFISVAGAKSFRDVNNLEGSTTRILPPQKLDWRNYRRGKVPHLEGESAEVDGVAFAEIDNGDCFVFDVSAKGNDYPVFWLRHEENTLEPYAPNFAECIKRFAQRN